MKFAGLLLAFALSGCCCQPRACCPPTRAASVPQASQCGDLPLSVPFVLGQSDLRPGDQVTILGVRGDRPSMTTGGRYCVWGRYTLASAPSATLCMWSTNGETEGTEKERCANVTGTGDFVFRFSVKGQLGQPHVSFYPSGGGDGMGGVYFANAESK